MKKHLLSPKAGIRHLSMLGLSVLAYAWSYLCLSSFAGDNLFADIHKNAVSQDAGILVFILFGLLFSSAALSGFALFWYGKAVAWPAIKKTFFDFFGWLPYLQKFDKLRKQEKEEYEARKTKREWDRENPEIKIEKVLEYDDYGEPYYVKKAVLQNPVKPVSDETHAFIWNLLRRLFLGLCNFFIGICLPCAIPLVITFFALLVLSGTKDVTFLFVAAVLSLFIFFSLYVVQPILALVLNAPAKEAPQENEN